MYLLQARRLRFLKLKSELFDHELEHCRLQYEGITYPTLSKNLSPLSHIYVTSDGIGLIEELIAYTNEYKGLEKWGIDTEEKRKEIVSNMKQYIHALERVAYEGNEYVRIFSEPIINGFLSYLNWQVPDAFKEDAAAPQKKGKWKDWVFKKIGIK